MMKRFIAVAVLVTAAGCGQCGQKSDVDPTPDAPSLSDRVAKMLSGLPAATVTTPAEALPAGIEWMMTSPNADAYRTWAQTQPFYQRFEKTALYREVVMNETFRALDQVDRRVIQAVAMTGQNGGLWKGAVSVGIRPAEGPPDFVAIRAGRPAEQSLLQFASSFATVVQSANLDDDIDLNVDHELGHPVYTLMHAGHPIYFALFSNLTIVSNSHEFVETAVARSLKGSKASDPGLALPPHANEAGFHVGYRRYLTPDGDLEAYTSGLSLMVSLVPDAAAPVRLWRPPTARAPAADASTAPLGRYVPKSAAFVVHDAADASLMAWAKALTEDDDDDQDRVARVRAVVDRLRPGMVVALGGGQDQLEAQIVVSHSDRAALEPAVRTLIKRWAASPLTRTETTDGDVVIGIKDGPAVGLTDDALVIALSTGQVRQALAAARGAAPSITDRPEWPKTPAGGILVDFAQAGPALTGFYDRALDTESGWSDVRADLRETLEGLATAGTLAGPWTVGPQGTESILRVAP